MFHGLGFRGEGFRGEGFRLEKGFVGKVVGKGFRFETPAKEVAA